MSNSQPHSALTTPFTTHNTGPRGSKRFVVGQPYLSASDMGNNLSTDDNLGGDGSPAIVPGRTTGVTEARQANKPFKLPPGATKSTEADWPYITVPTFLCVDLNTVHAAYPQQRLANLLLFNDLDPAVQRQVVSAMYERPVQAGEILIKEGDLGASASELYVVKSGEFEVLQKRQGVNFRVNMKGKGDIFGEVALLYNCARNATVAATKDSVVWVLERDVFRYDDSECCCLIVRNRLCVDVAPCFSQHIHPRDAKSRGQASGGLHEQRPHPAKPECE